VLVLPQEAYNFHHVFARIFEAEKKFLSFKTPSATTPFPSSKRFGIAPV